MARPKSENKFIRKDITMEPEQYRKLTEYCESIERPLSWVIRKAVREYLENNVA
ncbi:ribbon-helix-helix protein, CopG family [Lachnospiraceae bacterium 54-11]